MLTRNSVWKPLYGPVSDWPLGVCDAQTVVMDRDCMATDVVTRTGFTENYQIYHNEGHLWYYLSQQLADEVVVFRQTDTDEKYETGKLVPYRPAETLLIVQVYRMLGSEIQKLLKTSGREKAWRRGHLSIMTSLSVITLLKPCLLMWTE
jgi:hypothetical protein